MVTLEVFFILPTTFSPSHTSPTKNSQLKQFVPSKPYSDWSIYLISDMKNQAKNVVILNLQSKD